MKRLEQVQYRVLKRMAATHENVAAALLKKKERKKWRASLSPKAMGPRAVAGGLCTDVAEGVAEGAHVGQHQDPVGTDFKAGVRHFRSHSTWNLGAEPMRAGWAMQSQLEFQFRLSRMPGCRLLAMVSRCKWTGLPGAKKHACMLHK
jgi:hypothetical protein